MFKSILILSLALVLSSCAGDKPEIEIPPAKSVSYNKAGLELKAEDYSFRLQFMKDEYGLLLPKLGGAFIQQGDALLWNSIALASFCLLHSETETLELWNSFKHLQTEDGRLFRHPLLKDGVYTTSVSKDGILGFLFLGAISKETNCIIQEHYKTSLEKFAQYVVKHDYEMGVGETDLTVTYLSDRHTLRMVLRLFDLPSEHLDFKTSVHDLYFQTRNSNAVYNHNADCKNPVKSPFMVEFCSSDWFPGVFGNHLTYLSVYIAFVEAKNIENPVHSMGRIKDYTKYLAQTGIEKGTLYWPFVQLYRITRRQFLFEDINSELMKMFPEKPPSESNQVEGWGCTDYIWQRIPFQKCNNDSTQYLGLDLLLPFSISRFYSE